MNQDLGFATLLTCPGKYFIYQVWAKDFYFLGKTFICNLTCYNIIKANVKGTQIQSTSVPSELLLSVNAQLYLHGWHSWEMTYRMKLKWHQWLRSKTVNSYTTIKHKTSSSIIAWKKKSKRCNFMSVNVKGSTLTPCSEALVQQRHISKWQTVISVFLTFNFKQTEPFSRPSFPDGLLPHASKMCQYLTISTRCQILTEATSP